MSKQFTPEERRQLAELAKVDEQYLYQCLTGRRDMNPAKARAAEVATNGILTRQMLCQQTWRAIWPELIELARSPSRHPAQRATDKAA